MASPPPPLRAVPSPPSYLWQRTVRPYLIPASHRPPRPHTPPSIGTYAPAPIRRGAGRPGTARREQQRSGRGPMRQRIYGLQRSLAACRPRIRVGTPLPPLLTYATESKKTEGLTLSPTTRGNCTYPCPSSPPPRSSAGALYVPPPHPSDPPLPRPPYASTISFPPLPINDSSSPMSPPSLASPSSSVSASVLASVSASDLPRPPPPPPLAAE